MHTKAIIFDVDGVLVDSVPYHFVAWEKMFAEEGILFTYQDYLKKVNGQPRLTGIKNILPKLSAEHLHSLAEKKQTYYLEAIEKNPPLPLKGVRKLLKKLHTHQYMLAAASSSKNAFLLLEKTKLLPFFQHITSGHDFIQPKPHPEIFLHAATAMHVQPAMCVVVEDAASGVQAAKAAGMRTIGILSSKDTHIGKYADIVLPSLSHIQHFFHFLTTSLDV